MNNPPEDYHRLKRWFQRHLDPLLQEDSNRFDRERWRQHTLPAQEIRRVHPDRRWVPWAAASAAAIAAVPFLMLMTGHGFPPAVTASAASGSSAVQLRAKRLSVHRPANMDRQPRSSAPYANNTNAAAAPSRTTPTPVEASRLPRGATSVTITRLATLAGWVGPSRLTTRWTRPRWITLATTDIRHALLFQDVYGPGPVNCPADNGVYYVLVFHYAHQAAYTAVTDLSGCGSLTLYVGSLSATEAVSLQPSGPSYVPQQLGALIQSGMPKNMSPSGP